jgi:hypothetical protein
MSENNGGNSLKSFVNVPLTEIKKTASASFWGMDYKTTTMENGLSVFI